MENLNKTNQKLNIDDFSCLFWDLDGTLTESGPGIKNCVKYALESFGIHETDEKKLDLFIGPPLIESFSTLYGFSEEKSRAAMAKYRERFGTTGIFENSVYDGIIETLNALKAQGKRLFVATGKPEIYMFRILDHYGLSQFIEFAGGSDLEETRSEKAQIIDFVIKQNRLETELKEGKILMIGDRKHDIIGAHKNGMKCCGVLWGYGSLKEMEEFGADYVIETPDQLLKPCH